MKILKFILLFFSLFFIFNQTFAQSSEENTSQKLLKIIESGTIEGCAVAILTKDTLLYKSAFGWADKSKEIPYSTQTVQPIASISKTLVGVSLLKAQELGLLKLDDEIDQYLPFTIDNPYDKSEITIRHLATHTSSLKDSKRYEESYIFKKKIPPHHKDFPLGLRRMAVKRIIKRYNTNEDISQVEFLKRIYHSDGVWYKKSNFLKSEPGLKYEYSNNGAALASLIIENASGMSYEAFVKKHILKPLKMGSSGWNLDEFSEAQKAKLYMAGYELPEYKLITKADGGFVTNIDDFSNYFFEMMTGYVEGNAILKKESVQEMMTAYTLSDERAGIFWELNDNQIGHGGGDPGIVTFAFFDKEKLKANIIFMNTSDVENQFSDIEKIFKILDEHFEEHIKNQKR